MPAYCHMHLLLFVDCCGLLQLVQNLCSWPYGPQHICLFAADITRLCSVHIHQIYRKPCVRSVHTQLSRVGQGSIPLFPRSRKGSYFKINNQDFCSGLRDGKYFSGIMTTSHKVIGSYSTSFKCFLSCTDNYSHLESIETEYIVCS